MIGAALRRALGSLRRRPGPTFAAMTGLLLAGVLVGTATTTGLALATGFDRAQRAAGTADIIARFDAVDRTDAVNRLEPLANVRDMSFRYIIRHADIVATTASGSRSGDAEANGLEPGHLQDGLAIVAGRALSGVEDEVVIDRGLADEWGLGPGSRMRVDGERVRVVGVAVEPDNVAFPLASRPRVYMRAVDVEALRGSRGRDQVNAAYVRVVDRDRLAETLVQARTASYGVTGLTFTTRAGVRALVDEAGGLVGGLLVAFAAVALISAAAMLAASAHARVTRDLPTIGALRAVGFTPFGLALSYALEAMLVALPAAAIGVVVGALVVDGPTSRLLFALNELPPAHTVTGAHVAAIGGIVALAGLAAGWPAFAAARRPVVESLRGARTAHPRGSGSTGRPVVLGARLALARPGRLLVSALAVAAAVATILLLLALARFLLEAQREPSVIGERYSLVVSGGDALPSVRATPGVAAAAERLEARGVDVFNLGEPLSLVAYGDGDVFTGRPLLEGRRARAPDEVEVGRGLAQALGLGPGGQLLAQLDGGGEIRLRVSGVVQELSRDGRIGYTSLSALQAALPGQQPDVAVRPADGVSAGQLARRLQARGLFVQENAGLAPAGAPFVGTIVALLRVVAVVDALVCGAIVLLSLLVLARERAETIAVLRASGAEPRQVLALLAGASGVLLAVAVPVGYALERGVFGPLLTGLVEQYGALPLAPAMIDVLLVLAGALAIAAATALAAARRLVRLPVVDVLRLE